MARRQPPDVRREQILDAAERVLLDRGLGASTMAHVAEAAGVAKGTLYLYFESKAELIAALRARYLERFAAALGSRRATTKRLERFIEGLFDFSVANHRLHHLLFHEAGFSEVDAFAGARQLLADIVAGHGGRDPERTTDFLLHGLHGVLVAALHDEQPDRRRYVRGATALARRLLP